jgi:signal recognition particle subunit SRP54
MLVGLQGSGKTTTAGKLAYLHKNKLHKKVLLAGLDVYRPAAIDQLGQIAEQVQVDFFQMGTSANPVEVAQKAQEKARAEGYDLLVLDTAGRLQIDEKVDGGIERHQQSRSSGGSLAFGRCDGWPRCGQRRQCFQ